MLLIGLSFGVGLDMIAYFASHYLGRRPFGAIYGCLYGITAMGSGVGTYLVGVEVTFQTFRCFGSRMLWHRESEKLQALKLRRTSPPNSTTALARDP